MKQRAKRLCSLLMVLCLLVGLVPFSAFATETSDSGVEFLYQQLVLGDDLTMKFELAIEESVAEMAEVKLTVDGAETAYTVSTNENGNYLVSVDVAAAQMTDDIVVSVVIGETVIASKTYTVLAYAQQILNGNYGSATQALVKEMLNYGAKAQTYFDYKAGSLSEYDGAVTPATMPTEAEAISVEGSVDGIKFYGSSMLFTGKLAIRYYFTAPNGVEGYTFTSNGNTYEADTKNSMYYVDVAGINPQDIDEPVVLTVSDESSSLSVGYGPMNYITRMYNGNSSDNLKNLLQALYGYHIAAEAFVESGETQEEVEELAIPENATLISYCDTDFTPWVNGNWGSGDLESQWYSVFQGRAGVLGVGSPSTGNVWNHFSTPGSVSEADAEGKTLVIRYYATQAPLTFSVYGVCSITDVEVEIDVSEFKVNEWAEIRVDLTEFFDGQSADQLFQSVHIRLGSSSAGEFFYIDQMFIDIEEAPVEELAIPEGTRMITDFSETVTPHIPNNWGSYELAAYNSYDVYEGRAGVFGMGATGEGYMWYNDFGLNGIDLSTAETITFRMMVKSGTRALWIKHDETADGIDVISQIPAFDEWIEFTYNVADLGITDLSNATIQLRFATTIGAGQSEWVWLDQVYVTEKAVEELAIPEGATMIADFSTAVTPHIPETWGSGAAGAYYNSYNVYNGRAGVFAMGATGESFVWYNAFGLNDIDLSNAETITFRMKVKSGLRALWIKHDETEGIDIINQISAFDEWIEYTCNVADLGITDLSNATIQLRIATWDNGNCEYVWLDQVYVVNKVVEESEYPAAVPTYEQNRETKKLNVLAFWMPPIEDQHYQWMQEAGITALVIDNQYNAYEGAPLRKALSLCDKYGIDAYIGIARESASADYPSNYALYMDHPSLKGFYVDEPTTEEEINNVAAMTISAEAMGLQVIANKMPWTDADYTEWFNTAFANCGDNLTISATNYPLKTDSIYDTWLEINYLTNQAAAAYGADYWQFVATCGYGDRRQVTEADIRWQYYAALAYGAKGIADFAYTTPSYGTEFNDPQHAPIWWTDSSDTSTYYRADTYYYLQAVNQEIGKFDHVLLSFDWQGAMVNAVGSNSATTAVLNNAGGVVSTNRRINAISSSKDLLVGCFQDADNYDGFLIVNFDETLNNTAANTVSITFNNASTALAYVKGERQIVTLTNGVYTCELLPGEAVFVIPVDGDGETQPSEIAIPEGAVLVEDFADCGNYDGVAGVKALTTGTYTDILPADFDYSSYSHITFRMKLADGASVTVGGKSISAVAGDWVDVSVKLSELTGTEAVISGNVWINQVYAQYIPEELAIPEGATLVSDFSSAASPWNNSNWGSGAVGISNWYAAYDGVAGVQALGMSADGYTMWTALLPEDFDYSDYTHLNIRLNANKDALRAIYMFDDNMNNVDIMESVTAYNQWITVKVKLEDIPGTLFGLANAAGTTGEMLWVDQVYVTTEVEVEELAIPEDATLISYCDTAFTPWVNGGWGSGDLESQWYSVFQGRAGVLGVGSPSTGNVWNHFSTPGSVSEADAEGKTLVIRYYATQAPLTFSVYGVCSITDVEVEIDVSEFKVNEWAELRVDLTEFFDGQSADQLFQSVHIRLGSSSAGEFFYIDQMFIDIEEAPVEELAIPEGATMIANFGTAVTPHIPETWGSGAAGAYYNSYDVCDGRAGVFAMGATGESFVWYNDFGLNGIDLSGATHITFRMKVKSGLRALWIKHDETADGIDIISQIPAFDEWTEVTVKVADLGITDLSNATIQLRIATWDNGNCEYVWLDQVYVTTEEVAEEVEELAIPEDATLISYCDTDFTPWVNGNWGSGDLESQWYSVFQGRAGVLGVGSPSTGNVWNHFSTPGSVSVADAEGKTLVIRYYATQAPLTFSVYGVCSITDVEVEIDVSEFKVNEWAELRVDLTEFFDGQSADQLFQSVHIRLGSSSAGEFFYIDQMYIDIIEPSVEELPIPEQAVLFTDYSKSWTPWVNTNWGSYDLTYQWYEEYQGRAGVMGYGSNVSGNSWNWFTLGNPMNFTDAADKFVVLRLYATNPVLTMDLYASGTNMEVSVTVEDIPTNQWYDLRVDISDMVGDGMGNELHMKLGTSVSGQTLFIDSIYFIEEVELPEGATLISNLGESFTPWVNGGWGSGDLESQWYPEFQGHSGVLGVGSPSTGNVWNHFSTPGSVSVADSEGKTLVIRYYATQAPLTFSVYGVCSITDVEVEIDVSEFKVNEWAEIRVDLTEFFDGQSADQLFQSVHIRLGSSSAGEFFYIDQIFIEIDESVVWQAGSFGGENVTHSVNTLGSDFENRIEISDNTAKLYIRDTALDSYQVGDRVKVAFKLYSAVEVGAYSTLTVSDEHKDFDGQFIGGQWYNVNYFASVASDETGKYVELGLNNAAGQTVYLRELAFSSDALPAQLFGGVTVEMLTHTNVDNAQMQGFLLTDGEYVLAIDSGYPTDDDHLYEELIKMAPDAHIDGWFISHGHDDHYGALLELLKDDKITIGTLYYHFPDATDRNGNTENLSMQNEFESIVQTRISEGKIGSVVEIGKGGVYTYGDMTIKTLNDAYFGSSNFLNDSTVVMKLETPGENLLFLGDLGDRGDVYLEDADFLAEIQDCSVVQMAHHGQNGTTQKFYNACTGMKMALYCAPDWLWNNDNGGGVNSGSWTTLYVRQWLRDMGVGVSYYMDGTDLILD